MNYHQIRCEAKGLIDFDGMMAYSYGTGMAVEFLIYIMTYVVDPSIFVAEKCTNDLVLKLE